jgi:hypothetical protein
VDKNGRALHERPPVFSYCLEGAYEWMTRHPPMTIPDINAAYFQNFAIMIELLLKVTFPT